MVMQAEEKNDQCITLRLVEDEQKVGAAGAPAPRDHEGAGIAHHVHEVDEGGHHSAHDHEQHRELLVDPFEDRKSTRLNSSHLVISYAVFCLKKKKKKNNTISSQ